MTAITRTGRPSIAEDGTSTRIAITIDPTILMDLDSTARCLDISRAEAIRQAVDAWLKATPWSNPLVRETAQSISELADMDWPGNSAVVLSLDSEDSAEVWIADLDDAEATALPYIVLADLDDDLTDKDLATTIDYEYAMNRVRKQWLAYPTVTSLAADLAADGYDPDEVESVISEYSESPSLMIGNETYLAPETVGYIRNRLDD